MVKTSLKRWEITALVLVLLAAAFCRLYRISEYMTFLGDEGRDVLVMRDIVLGRHFPLIGPGTSVGSMYLGPLYYYLVAPSLLLAGFSPVGPAVEVALIGVATVFLVWWIGRQWLGPTIAVIISLLYALSPPVIIYSRSSWNPNVMPFFALLVIYGIWQVWRYRHWRWLIISAIAFAFVLNSHYLGLLLVPTIGLFWLLTPKKSTKISVLSLLVLLLLLSPLLFFDMRHGWTNLTAMKTFFAQRQTTVNFKIYKAFPNLWPIWTDINTSLLAAGDPRSGTIASAIIILTLTLTLTKKKYTPQLWLVSLWMGFGILGLGLYKQHIYTHYYGFLFPAPFFLLGFGLSCLFRSRLPAKILGMVGILILIYLMVSHNPFRSSPNLQLSRTREISAFITEKAQGMPFNLALVSKTNYDSGYRYFFVLMDSPYRTIHQQITGQLFVICENPEPAGECRPINNPLWEIAAFGWAKIDKIWNFPWDVSLYRLVPNPSGT
jgi:4-amino-4-deoxy-L-arabinose transferase-like glycosyltransferase